MSELSRKLDYAEKAALPTVAELELNADGSLVQLDAGDWFVCFVPGIDKQWWHPFVHHRHKHVFALRPAENCKWTLFEPWWTRLLTATISNEQAEKFLRWGARSETCRWYARQFRVAAGRRAAE